MAGRVMRIWRALGLDIPTLIVMAKGALPAAIFTAAYQATAVAEEFRTQGYLVTIVATLSLCILPRAKVVQLTIQNSIAVCLASATSLLGLWTSSFTRPPTHKSGYHAPAAVVCGVWLFASIWAVNFARARLPSLALPTIMYTIFVGVMFTSGGMYGAERGVALVKLLLKCFFTGFALSLSVGLVIVPVDCRSLWWVGFKAYLAASGTLLEEQRDFLKRTESPGGGAAARLPLEKAQEAHAEVYAKLSLEFPMAEWEVATGGLSTADFRTAFLLARATLLPVQGMTTILDIFDRALANDVSGDGPEERSVNVPVEEQLARVTQTLHEPYERIVAVCGEAIEHTLLLMKLTPTKKKKKDEESSALPMPGDENFCQLLEEKVQQFYSTRAAHVQEFFAKDFPPPVAVVSPESITKVAASAKGAQLGGDIGQLYLVLYMEYLLYNAAKSLLALARFAEEKKEEGSIDRTILVYPTAKLLKKWVYSMAAATDDEVIDVSDVCAVRAGGLDGIQRKKDPEHLPPGNSMQKIGNALGAITEGVSSGDSGFGLRVACATIAVALPAYFESSHLFFIEKRLVWAVVIIAIGMSPTSGASVIGFFGRVAGTVIAMILALINWYIVGGKTAGVIAFLWFFVAIQFYFVIKYPELIQSTLTALITHIIIICYELQVRKIGDEASTSSGQPILTVNQIGPYRLLVTLAGLFVAFLFTIFPYPVTTRSLIRRQTSSALFLLAQTYATVVSLVRTRIHSTNSTEMERGMEKQRVALLTETLQVVDALRKHSAFTAFEPSLRGRFPREAYDKVADAVGNISGYLSVIAFASSTLQRQAGSDWVKELADVLREVDTQEHKIAGVLCTLSMALDAARPLPPGLVLALAGRGRVGKALEQRGVVGASLDHLKEPGVVAVAVMKVAMDMLFDDLERLIRLVEGLVGTVEFPGNYGLEVDGSAESLKEKVT